MGTAPVVMQQSRSQYSCILDSTMFAISLHAYLHVVPSHLLLSSCQAGVPHRSWLPPPAPQPTPHHIHNKDKHKGCVAVGITAFSPDKAVVPCEFTCKYCNIPKKISNIYICLMHPRDANCPEDHDTSWGCKICWDQDTSWGFKVCWDQKKVSRLAITLIVTLPTALGCFVVYPAVCLMTQQQHHAAYWASTTLHSILVIGTTAHI